MKKPCDNCGEETDAEPCSASGIIICPKCERGEGPETPRKKANDLMIEKLERAYEVDPLKLLKPFGD